MSTLSRRAFAALIAVSTLLPGAAFAADALKEIRIDWATYNPVSMILKQKGLLEKEFAKDGISVVWVQSAGSNKALDSSMPGSIDFGSTAGSRRWSPGSTAIRSSRSTSIRARNGPRWLRPGIRKSPPSRTSRQARRGHPRHRPAHLLVRALLGAGLSEKDITPVLLQHADGKTALIRGDVDAWAGPRPDDGAGRSGGGRKLFFRESGRQHLGHPQCARAVLKDYPDTVRACSRCTREARKYSLANYDELKKTFIAVTKLPDARGRQAAQGAHRTDPQPDWRAAGEPSSPPGWRCSSRRRRRQVDVKRHSTALITTRSATTLMFSPLSLVERVARMSGRIRDGWGLFPRQPGARMDSRCGAPIRLWSVRCASLSCCRSTASAVWSPRERLLQLVVVGQRIFARLSVPPRARAHRVGIILQELLAAH